MSKNWFIWLFTAMLVLSLITVTACEEGDDDDDDDVKDDDSTDDDDASDDDATDDDVTDDDTTDDDTTDELGVESTDPADGDIERKLRTEVKIVFNRSMNTDSVKSAFSMEGAKADITGSFSWNTDQDEMTFTPEDNLTEDTSYTVMIGAGAQDQAGESFKTDYLFDFKTVNLWSAQYDASVAGAASAGYDIAVDSSLNVYVVGYDETGGGFASRDILIQKYDVAGVLQNTWHRGGFMADRGNAIALDDQGNIHITGYVTVSLALDTQVHTEKINPSGTTIWTATFDNYNIDSVDEGKDITVDDSGNVYVIGYTTTDTQGKNVWAYKYDSDGNSKDTEQLDYIPGDEDVGSGIALDNAGNIYISGQFHTGTSQYAGFLAKLDPTYFTFFTGNMLLMTYTPWYIVHDSMGYALTTDEAGTIYMAGYHVNSYTGKEIGSVWKVNNNLFLDDWEYDGHYTDYDFMRYYDIDLDSAGNVFVVGEEDHPAGGRAVYYKKLRADLLYYDLIEETFIDEIGDNAGRGIVVDQNDNFYITGYVTNSNGDKDLFIRKLDNDGNWVP